MFSGHRETTGTNSQQQRSLPKLLSHRFTQFQLITATDADYGSLSGRNVCFYIKTVRASIVTDGGVERLNRLVRALGLLFCETKGRSNFSNRHWIARKSDLRVVHVGFS